LANDEAVLVMVTNEAGMAQRSDHAVGRHIGHRLSVHQLLVRWRTTPISTSSAGPSAGLEAVIPCHRQIQGGLILRAIRFSEFERGISFAIVGGAEDHFIDRGSLQSRIALEQGSDHIRGQVVRPDSGECASEAAERGLYCAVQLCGGHKSFRFGRTCRGSGRPVPCRHAPCHR
jgi:hypothetical protein